MFGLPSCKKYEPGQNWGVQETRTLWSPSEQKTDEAYLSYLLPKGMQNRQPAVVATRRLVLESGAVVTKTPGIQNFSDVGIAVSFSEMQMGPDASVGALYLMPNSRAEVAPSSHVDTFVRAPPDLSLPPISAWGQLPAITRVARYSLALPKKNGGKGETVSVGLRRLQPNRHGAFVVKAEATLRLDCGTHYFDALNIEEAATLEVDNRSCSTWVWVLGRASLTGRIVPDADHPTLAFLLAAETEVQLSGPLNWTLLAPHARIRLERYQEPHRGAVYAAQVELARGTRLQHRPLMDIDQYGSMWPPYDLTCDECETFALREVERCLAEASRQRRPGEVECVSKGASVYDECHRDAKLAPGACLRLGSGALQLYTANASLFARLP